MIKYSKFPKFKMATERNLFNPEKANGLTAITAKNFSLFAGTKRLIDTSSFTIDGSERIALVGRNGAGKTVLLETIYSVDKKTLPPDGVFFEGLLEISPETRIGYLPQDLQINFDGSVEEYLEFSSHETAEVVKDFDRLSNLIKTDPSETNTSSLARIIELMDTHNGWDYQERKKNVIQGLGLSSQYLCKSVREISGGEATKVALAGVLISSPNIILLDEPTNNLDIKSVLFLEEWIKKQKSIGFVIVSHDRRFLDNISDRVWEIDEETSKIVSFGGDYSFYRQEKMKIFEGRLRDYEIAVKKKRQLEKEAQRLKSNIGIFETTSTEAFFRKKGAKLQKKATQMRTRAEKIISETPEPQSPKIPRIEVGEVKPGEANILSVNNLFFCYSEGEKEFFGGFSFSFHQGERIAVIGPNGSGKSTFLKILSGELRSSDPHIEFNQEMKIEYLPQSLILTNPKENLLDFCCHFITGHRDDINSMLGKVLFEDSSRMRVGNLSVGELKRVLLSVFFLQSPDCLLLDEPINHLDLYTTEMLDKALEQYKGAVIAISHDRYFLEKFGAKRLLVINNGKIIEIKIDKQEELMDAFEHYL